MRRDLLALGLLAALLGAGSLAVIDRSPSMPGDAVADEAERAKLEGIILESKQTRFRKRPQVDHWAYHKPTRPCYPMVRNVEWARNGIDTFILARLEAQGLQPSPPASPEHLIRRVYLDLIGLPPTPAQVDAFLSDHSPGAYERVVEELLHSPRYGERWASHWLDLARYADSHGIGDDALRAMWPYRDWVIGAFNRDLPFDQFTIEQLAGDLLPNATLEQIIATGFHRCSVLNLEAGTDPEEEWVLTVADRVNTTGQVWLGTTIGCAQCHDHKHDPFTLKDYYQLCAFFNNTAAEMERSDQGKVKFIGPQITIPSKYSKPVTNPVAAPTTLVMRERCGSRDTFILRGGHFRQPKDKVRPDVPAALPPLPSEAPRTRLGLARWLVSRENPLTARVTVNRFWTAFFGRGLVATLEDFGTQSEPPSHPELLDWLAVEFMENWSIKHLHRLIVTSATYRQSARLTEAGRRLDPANRWYSRAPRLRLPAELIRDNALAVSGLLNPKMGGPPVFPPQPVGLWNMRGDAANIRYDTSTGTDRYRRGVYAVWRRTCAHPSFTAFDAPNRSTCTVARACTNTPIQALTLLNDPLHGEAALALAQIIQVAEGTPRERIVNGFRRVVTRAPRDAEVTVLEHALTEWGEKYRAGPQAAREFVAKWSVSNPDAASLAAWYHLATILLNLDEAITN
jgi:hypothetical protein